MSEFYNTSAYCIPHLRKRRAAAQATYRQKHEEKVKAYGRSYISAHPEANRRRVNAHRQKKREEKAELERRSYLPPRPTKPAERRASGDPSFKFETQVELPLGWLLGVRQFRTGDWWHLRQGDPGKMSVEIFDHEPTAEELAAAMEQWESEKRGPRP